MQLERKNLCPLLKKGCIKLDCAWFVKITGTNPQDKEQVIDEWGCAIGFQVVGLLEVAKRIGGGLDGLQKATESYRNETVRGSKEVISGLVALVNEAQELVAKTTSIPQIGAINGEAIKEIAHARGDQQI